jgi:hypothetical protein
VKWELLRPFCKVSVFIKTANSFTITTTLSLCDLHASARFLCNCLKDGNLISPVALKTRRFPFAIYWREFCLCHSYWRFRMNKVLCSMRSAVLVLSLLGSGCANIGTDGHHAVSDLNHAFNGSYKCRCPSLAGRHQPLSFASISLMCSCALA